MRDYYDPRLGALVLVLLGMLLGGALGSCVHEARAQDPRLCGAPARDARGDIVRSDAVLREFERLHPRPATIIWPGGMTEGWIKDHVVPLACGGCDSVSNLQWLPESAWRWKSRWERRVYGGQGISEGCP